MCLSPFFVVRYLVKLNNEGGNQMPTTVMTPEEVLKYGKRIVLFSEGKRTNTRVFVVEEGRIFQQAILIMFEKRHVVKTNPVDIMDIYDKIERVYSQQRKGVLIARRSGNYKSNQKRLLPLKKTGKGMGEMVSSLDVAKKAYELLETVENHEQIKSAAQERIRKKIKMDIEKKKKSLHV